MKLTKIIMVGAIIAAVAKSSLLPWNWDSAQTNNELRTMSIWAANDIPVVGSLVSLSLSLFWPTDSEDMWTQIQQQVTSLVDQSILTVDLEHLNANLEDIQWDMAHYNSSVSNPYYTNGTNIDACNWLDLAIHDCEDVWDYINASTADQEYLQMFPIMVPLSSLHLANLKERYRWGAQVCGQPNPAFKTELQTWYDLYKNWFVWYYPEWQTWRYDQISADSNTYHGWFSGENSYNTYDHVTGVRVKCDSKYLNDGDESHFSNGARSVMYSESISFMMDLMTPTFYLHQYVPWMANNSNPILPSFAAAGFNVGPYATSSDPWKCGMTGYDGPNMKYDTEGMLKAVSGRAGNSIDRLQMKYTTHNGQYVGDAGGSPFNYAVKQPTQWITSIAFAFLATTDGGYVAGIDHSIMYKLSWMHNDYTTSPIVGNKGSDWDGPSMNVTVNNEWQLVQIGQAQRSGPAGSGTYGTFAIEFRFEHNYIAQQKYGTTNADTFEQTPPGFCLSVSEQHLYLGLNERLDASCITLWRFEEFEEGFALVTRGEQGSVAYLSYLEELHITEYEEYAEIFDIRRAKDTQNDFNIVTSTEKVLCPEDEEVVYKINGDELQLCLWQFTNN